MMKSGEADWPRDKAAYQPRTSFGGQISIDPKQSFLPTLIGSMRAQYSHKTTSRYIEN